MEAYDVIDRQYAAAMKFDREDNNRDRFYSYPVRCDGAAGMPQENFYRAMNRTEALGWLAPGRTAVPDSEGHHPWASYRNYSLSYLTRKNNYTYLLEVHAPDFLPWMREIGFISGKAEAGDISWGIGGKSSNGWGGTKPANDALKALYKHAYPTINRNLVKGGLRALAVQLAPYMFKQSIKWVKVVNLRSQKP